MFRTHEKEEGLGKVLYSYAKTERKFKYEEK